LWLAAVDTPTGDTRTAVTLAIIGLLSALGVSLVGGLFSWLVARQRKTAEPVADATAVPVAGMDLAFRDYLVRELAKGEQRDDQNDERDDVQDRRHVSSEHRLDLIEWHLDRTEPGWRHDR
jgi:hypothetical protein